MKEPLNNIEHIFNRKLSGYKAEVESSEWKLIESKLNVKNFFRFSFSTFNLYYTILTILFCSSGLYFFTASKKNSPSNLNNYKSNEISVQKSCINDSIIQENFNKNKEKQISPQPKHLSSKSSSTVTTDSIIGTTQDSINIIAHSDTFKVQHKTKRILKRTVYIKDKPVIMRDTIELK